MCEIPPKRYGRQIFEGCHIGANRCQIAVFHFGKVPPLLEKIARARNFLDCALSPAQARRIAEIEMELRVPYGRVTEKLVRETPSPLDLLPHRRW